MSTRRTPFTQRDALDRFERMAVAHKKAIGLKIADLRKARGWSQPELAAQIDVQEVDAQQVSKWERGVHTPTKHLEALAKALGVQEGEIMSGLPENENAGGDLLGQFNGQSEATEAEREILRKLEQVLDQQAELLASVSAVRAEQERLRQPQERGGRGKANSRK
jgi:transcriptional regulator with XRE-family HTH domain